MESKQTITKNAETSVAMAPKHNLLCNRSQTWRKPVIEECATKTMTHTCPSRSQNQVTETPEAFVVICYL